MSRFLNAMAEQARRQATKFSCEDVNCQCGKCIICMHRTVLPVHQCNCNICAYKRETQALPKQDDEKPIVKDTWQERHELKYLH